MDVPLHKALAKEHKDLKPKPKELLKITNGSYLSRRMA